MTSQEIVNGIIAYMDRFDRVRSHWYVGITDDRKRRLTEHGVDSTGVRIVYDASTESNARAIESHFVNVIGTDGGGGGGTRPTFVYAYLKSQNTNP